ncbi:MAG: nucleotide pyrophosphohydrolase [Nanoarchaeota archaeon]|nr:nucleotide pyrophosphohydrolase [Nanoarchaeota archaeon]MBU1005387.1 nucleotide pyrophosphohydrolase [Nanoarchaeota archaeon]MBU1945669.1 nucleotide pyrophosphohydrolase [Nanoarchaeota archaeon]
MDSTTNIQELKDKIKKFCEERDWNQFHNAKDLAIGIITESSELLEHFRFKSENEVEEILNSDKRKEVTEELADIMFFVLRLAQRYDIDLSTELEEKIKKSAEKYPIEKAKGTNKKYNEL